jgi:hypothetical protein
MHHCIDHHVWRNLFPAYGANHPGDAALSNFYNLGFWLIALLHDTLFRFVTQYHPTPSRSWPSPNRYVGQWATSTSMGADAAPQAVRSI